LPQGGPAAAEPHRDWKNSRRRSDLAGSPGQTTRWRDHSASTRNKAGPSNAGNRRDRHRWRAPAARISRPRPVAPPSTAEGRPQRKRPVFHGAGGSETSRIAWRKLVAGGGSSAEVSVAMLPAVDDSPMAGQLTASLPS